MVFKVDVGEVGVAGEGAEVEGFVDFKGGSLKGCVEGGGGEVEVGGV